MRRPEASAECVFDFVIEIVAAATRHRAAMDSNSWAALASRACAAGEPRHLGFRIADAAHGKMNIAGRWS
jgi:hypothetical protein